jgi:hypothetical protein
MKSPHVPVFLAWKPSQTAIGTPQQSSKGSSNAEFNPRMARNPREQRGHFGSSTNEKEGVTAINDTSLDNAVSVRDPWTKSDSRAILAIPGLVLTAS